MPIFSAMAACDGPAATEAGRLLGPDYPSGVTQQVSVSLSVLQQGMEIAGSVLLLLLVVLLRIIGCLVA
jgi:hypothetical protein